MGVYLFVCLYSVTCIPLHAARRAMAVAGRSESGLPGTDPWMARFAVVAMGRVVWGLQDLQVCNKQYLPSRRMNHLSTSVWSADSLPVPDGWCFRRCAVGRMGGSLIIVACNGGPKTSATTRAQRIRDEEEADGGGGGRRPAPPPKKNRRRVCGFSAERMQKFLDGWLGFFNCL